MSSDSEGENNIPMADEDPSSVIEDDSKTRIKNSPSTGNNEDSAKIHKINVDGSVNPSASSGIVIAGEESGGGTVLEHQSILDEAEQQQITEEQEEKARLIAQVLELQNTLDDLSSRVDNVKEENLRLRSENQVLGQYIENLMAASSVFQPANEQPMNKGSSTSSSGPNSRKK